MIPAVPTILRYLTALPFLAIGAAGIIAAEWISPEMFGHRSRDVKEPRT